MLPVSGKHRVFGECQEQARNETGNQQAIEKPSLEVGDVSRNPGRLAKDGL